MKMNSLSSITILFLAFAFAASGALVSANAGSAAASTGATPVPTPAGAKAKAADAEFKRLLRLRTALGKIPPDKLDREPHKSFIKRNEKDIVYSDPAGQWFVRSDLFWALSKKYATLPIADDIAWAAAENPVPGECEGYVNCHVYVVADTYGRYLRSYPDGRSSKKALAKMTEYLGYIADDISDKKGNYEGPAEASDRAELAKTIGEMRAVLAGVSHAERAKVISQLDTIGGAFK